MGQDRKETTNLLSDREEKGTQLAHCCLHLFKTHIEK